jgi:hypothetical protein
MPDTHGWTLRGIAFLTVDLVVVVAYFTVGIRRSEVAHRYLREPDKTYWFAPLLEPELFTQEGQAYRQSAMRFWNRGGLAVIAYFVLANWLARHL